MKTRRVMAVILLLALLAAPSLAEGPFTLMGLESDSSNRAWEGCLFFERMEALTGVGFTFAQYGDESAYMAAKAEAFANGNLPDALFKARLTPAEEMDYLAQGLLIDLAPYLAEYAPNLSAILAARPDWARVVAQPNGAITSLPILSGADRQCCIWINQGWLEALNLAMPATIDEYTETLRAFRDRDPNGNGKRDEIPLSVVGPWEAKFLLHAWGLTPNDYNVYVDDGGAVHFAPFDPRYRDFMEWLRMALEESLIDPSAFRQSQGMRSTAQTTDTNAPQTLGGMITIAPYTVVEMGQTTSYAVLPPLVHEGGQVYRMLLNGVGRGAFAVTSACADVPAMLRWADVLYSEAGGRLAFAGAEGEDYHVAENGAWQWQSDGDYARLTGIIEKSIIAGDAYTPGLEPAAFMRNSEIEADNHARRQVDTVRNFLKEPFPVTWPVDNRREARIAELQETLAACIDTAIANFAMGIVELNDEHYTAFLEELRVLGAEEFVTLWQDVYDGV